MKPAFSLIIFTVFSGFGFGLLFWLNSNINLAANFPNYISYPLAFTIALIGLISSTFHLGNPQRALLAFTQWRTSWLSREAILASLALILSCIHAYLILVNKIYLSWLGLISSGLCLLTIFSTAMIYTQMKTVPRWNMKVTPTLFLLYGLVGSSVILNEPLFSLFLFLILGLVQIITWKRGDQKNTAKSSIKTATGISIGNKMIRMLEPPHTGSNYLMKEMINIIAQKHIFKLRWISLSLISLLPAGLSAVIAITETNSTILLLLITLVNLLGTLIARWLFFSEAEHVVGLYYDR